jgi:hypothetical protein
MDDTRNRTLKIMAKHGLPLREEEQQDIDHKWGSGFETTPANPIVEDAIRRAGRKRRHGRILERTATWLVVLGSAVLTGWSFVKIIDWLFKHYIWSAR